MEIQATVPCRPTPLRARPTPPDSSSVHDGCQGDQELPHPILMEQSPTQVTPHHCHQSHGGQRQQGNRGQRLRDVLPDFLLVSQGRRSGTAGAPSPDSWLPKDRGQGQHGQGHAAHHAKLRHSSAALHTPLYQLAGNEGGIDGPHHIAKQGVAPYRKGDGGILRRRIPARSPGPISPWRRLRRWKRAESVAEENSSQITIPVTMRPTTRSGYWGRKRASSPNTAAVRTSCSSSSTTAGGPTSPAP